MAIKSFADKETEKIFARVRSSKLPQDMQQLAYRKLRMLHNAYSIQDLRVPPSNRLEKLRARGKGGTVSASISNGVFALSGKTAMPIE